MYHKTKNHCGIIYCRYVFCDFEFKISLKNPMSEEARCVKTMFVLWFEPMSTYSC